MILESSTRLKTMLMNERKCSFRILKRSDLSWLSVQHYLALVTHFNFYATTIFCNYLSDEISRPNASNEQLLEMRFYGNPFKRANDREFN